MADGANQENYHKVIIVGGSVAGLTLALALERTDIDFILLEKGDFAPPLGASFVLAGCAMRILDQLGLVEGIKKVGETFKGHYWYHEEGLAPIVGGEIGALLEEKTGYPFAVMERREVLDVLYAGIKDKSKLLSRNGAVSFTEDDDGVSVTCEDGTVYRGDILVGADGIHSKVREFMFDRLEETELKNKAAKTRKECGAEFTCVFGNTPKVDGVTWPAGTAWNVCGTNRNIGGFIGKDDRFFFFYFEKIPLTYAPNIPRYTQEDAQKAMAQISHIKINEKVTVGDMFAQCTQYGKVALEEHMFDLSHSKRICIIGDSLHKMTPNDGWGGTLAIESAAYLANALNEHIVRTAPTPVQTTKLLLTQFASLRHNRVPDIIKKSGTSTRIQAGSDTLHRILRSIVSILPSSAIIKDAVNFHTGGRCINYLPKPQHKGTVPYIDEQPVKKGWFS